MPSGWPIERVVLDDAGMGVELAALDEGHEVAALLVVGEQDAVARRGAGRGRCSTGTCRQCALDRHRDRVCRWRGPGAGRTRRGRRASARRTTVHGCNASRSSTASRREAFVAAFEEAEQERRLRPRRAFLDRVQRFLVPEVPVARCHRALLDDVVDAGEHAVRGELALAQADQRLDLAGEPAVTRAAPGAGGRGNRSPTATRCRTARRLRRRGCGRSRRRRSRARARPR